MYIRYKNVCKARYHNMEIICQQRSSNSCNEKNVFTAAVLNAVSTIAAESPDVDSEAATDYFPMIKTLLR